MSDLALYAIAASLFAVAVASITQTLSGRGRPAPLPFPQGKEFFVLSIPEVYKPIIDKLIADGHDVPAWIATAVANAKADWQTAADADKAQAVQDAVTAALANVDNSQAIADAVAAAKADWQTAADADKAQAIQGAVAAALAEAASDDSDAAAALGDAADGIKPAT